MTDKEKREDLALLALAFAAFVGANLSGVTLPGIQMQRVNFARANLTGADLSGVSDFSGGARFAGAICGPWRSPTPSAAPCS